MSSFFIDFDQKSTEVSVVSDEYHHICKVFRHKVGEVIPILNGKGLSAQGKIVDITKKQIELSIFDIIFTSRTQKRVACAFSLLKNKNDLWIVEKLTELGVTDIFPIVTCHSVKQGKENTIEKYQKTAISAVKQCDNPYLPNIYEVNDLTSLLKLLIEKKYTPIVASETRPNLTLTNYLKNNINLEICIIIGCEGGWDKKELNFFEANNIIQVKLVENILRAETAAICAVSKLVD